MWKEFFYFNKGQRIGIIVLILLIVIVQIFTVVLPLFFTSEPNYNQTFIAEVNDFKKSLFSRDSLLKLQRQKEYESKYKNFSQQFDNKYNNSYQLFNFDPNSLDSASFVRLGLKSYTASNILKYRSKGGKFRTALDFSKVYGILPQKFKELEPYIVIKTLEVSKSDSAIQKKLIKPQIIVELNSADTTMLMQIKGIGRGYAKGIVNYRRVLGGFVAVEQLKEIYGMRAENYQRIAPFVKVNSELIQKIKVNICSVERLNSHPYINFYQAKAVYELRRNKGKLKNINELRTVSEIQEEDIKKIQPYLSFE